METRPADPTLASKRQELADLIARSTPSEGATGTAVAPLTLIRADQPTAARHLQQSVALWIVAQGRKRLTLVDETFEHGSDDCLLVSFDLPVVTRVVEASPEQPFLGLALVLDPAEVAASMTTHDLGASVPDRTDLGRGVSVRPATPALLDAAIRLVRVAASPADARALAPLVLEEVRYRLLSGPHGAFARQIARVDPRLQAVARATEWLQQTYAEPYRLEALTRAAGLSASALHLHFRAVTGMTPLQYQKELRLREARTRMLGEGLNAATAGYRVGYASPSQFSREYKRLFGASPARDVARLQAG